MVASVQSWQFVHSATSMIMFHFFIALLSESVGWATARNSELSGVHGLLRRSPPAALHGGQRRATRHFNSSSVPGAFAHPTHHFAGTNCASRSVRLISAS